MSLKQKSENFARLEFSQNWDDRTSSNLNFNKNLDAITKQVTDLHLNKRKGYYVEYFKKPDSNKPFSSKEEIKIEKKKSLMSPNERRKLNQNSIEDKLLILKQKSLEKRLSYSQLMMKREKILLFEQLMETQTVNSDNIDYENSLNFNESNRVRTAANLFDCSSQSIDMEIGFKNKNVFDKFIDQKRRNLPNYLKHNTKQSTKSFYDLKKVIGKLILEYKINFEDF